MLTNYQIEEVGRLIEHREEVLDGLITSMSQVLEAADEVGSYVSEYAVLQEIKDVLKALYNMQASVDADTLGENFVWLQNKQQRGTIEATDELKFMIGYLQGKIAAGFVTQNDWDKLQALRLLLGE